MIPGLDSTLSNIGPLCGPILDKVESGYLNKQLYIFSSEYLHLAATTPSAFAALRKVIECACAQLSRLIIAPMVIFSLGGRDSNLQHQPSVAWILLGFLLMVTIGIGGGIFWFNHKRSMLYGQGARDPLSSVTRLIARLVA
jgi:hypothetical protein